MTRPHYPSWGSETNDPYAAQWLRNLSLPLMGIGNRQPSPTLRPPQPLITPHGDRKPAWNTPPVPICCSSLPLMGIGNAGIGVSAIPVPGLITPHGDRKRM